MSRQRQPKKSKQASKVIEVDDEENLRDTRSDGKSDTRSDERSISKEVKEVKNTREERYKKRMERNKVYTIEDLTSEEKKLTDKLPSLKYLNNDLDHEQIEILKAGHIGLIYVEEASDLIGRLKDVIITDADFLKDILSSIVSTSSEKYDILGITTFPFVFDAKYEYLGVQNQMTKDLEKNKEYKSEILRYRKKLKQMKNCVFLFAVDLDTAGGHYCVAIRKDDTIHLFDSMQKVEHKKRSEYTKFFEETVSKIFSETPIPEDVPVNLQPTGGFVDEKAPMSKKVDADSQNHFCYMWAMWFLHVFLYYDGNRDKIQEVFLKSSSKIDPTRALTVIKKYIWSIIDTVYGKEKLLDIIEQYFHLNKKQSKQIYDFYEHYFRFVYDGKQLVQVIEDTSVKRSINECFLYSIQ